MCIFQVLVTKPDFHNEFSRCNLRSTLAELCKLKIVPIINANDAVAPPPEPDKDLTGVSFNFFFKFDLCHIQAEAMEKFSFSRF